MREIRSFFVCSLALFTLVFAMTTLAEPSEPRVVAALDDVTISAKDLKTLHYMQNAHGQLDEWSLRLLARLERGIGPRAHEPILDGRADLQVKKIAVTYALYAKTPELAATLQELADAHGDRLVALQRMVSEGPDRGAYERLDQPVQEIVTALRNWSKKHEN